MALVVRLFILICPLLILSISPSATAQDCTGSPTGGFNCDRDDGGTAAIGTVFSASEAGGRRNVSLTLIEELVEEEAAPSGSGGGDPATGLEIFVAGGPGWQDYDTEDELGSDGDTLSGLAGVSYRGESFLAGFAFDVVSTDSDFSQNAGSRDSDEFGAQVFGTVFLVNNLYVSGGGRIAAVDIETKRSIDSPTNVARGETDGMKYGLTGGVGYNLPITESTVVGFSGWLDWEYTETDGYSETGATTAAASTSPDAPNLTFSDDDFTSLEGILRLEVAHAIQVGSALVVPSARAEYIHEFENDSRTIDAALPATGINSESRLSFRTNDPDRNFFRLGASVTVAFDEGTSLTAGYAGDVGHSWRKEQVVMIGLSHRF